MNQFTAVYSGSGELVSHIKYYDGFMGQRVGAISCLAFHPHWVCACPCPGRGAAGGCGGLGRAGGAQEPRAGGLQPAPAHPTGGREGALGFSLPVSKNGAKQDLVRSWATPSRLREQRQVPRQPGSPGLRRQETAPLLLSPFTSALIPALEKPSREEAAGTPLPDLCSPGRGGPALTVAPQMSGLHQRPPCSPGLPDKSLQGAVGSPHVLVVRCRASAESQGRVGVGKPHGGLPTSHPRPRAHPPCSPLQPHLAVGSNDYYISVYSVEKRAR